LLRVFLGGASSEELLEQGDDALIHTVRQDLEAMMGLTTAPHLTRLYRWPRGYPQYEVGHLERVGQIEAALPPGLMIAGSAYHGVGLPDCVRSGFAAAQAALSYLSAQSG
ncbi:MAG: FAD-dependent oxidoreductase, partial [Acidobacteriota bacterium]